MTPDSTSPRASPSRAARRVRQHFVLAGISVALSAATFAAVQSDDMLFLVSMATAYASLALLVFVLVVGPVNVLRDRPNPVSTNLRRDAAIWGGAMGLVHVIFGLQVHLRGKMYQYFFYPREKWTVMPIRFDVFGLANYTGLGATLILLFLLALSNDISLRRLGTRRWKSLQQTNYIASALIIAHGIVYQLTEKQKAPFVVIHALLIVTALAFQIVGFRRTRATPPGTGR